MSGRRMWVCVCLAVALRAAAAPGAEEGAPAKAPDGVRQKETVLSLLWKGGFCMYPLGLCSVLAVAISLERFLSLRREKVAPPGFLEGLAKALDKAAPEPGKGIAYCDERKSPVGNMCKAAIARLGAGSAVVEKTLVEAAALEVDKMRRSLQLLSLIGRVSPVLGLLGTVYGMITAFQAASMSAVAGRAETLAQGIYEALVTTAVGLTIAIPTMVVLHYLTLRVDTLTDDLDEIGNGFLNHYVHRTDAA